MIGNNSLNNPLLNNYSFRNPVNYMDPNFYYQQFNNSMNMNQMNINFIPYQLYQNNFNNYENGSFYNNNIFYNNYTNKFNINYSKFIPKPLFSKNNENRKNTEKIKLKNEETSNFENENESKYKKIKKYSIDSTTSTEEEKNEKENKENLKINDIENKNENCMDEDDYKLTKAKIGGRRFSNSSKSSDCSKCSKSTLNTSISSIKEKEVLEENINNLKEKECENKKEIKNETEKYQGNPGFENTVILNVQVKLSKDRTAIFKLKRYDDLFLTIKLFCEINSVDEELIKPLIVKSLSTINTIYQIMNTKLNNEQINMLNKIKNI